MKLTNIALAIALVLPAGGIAVAADEIEIVGTGDGMNVLNVLGTAFSEMNPSVIIGVPDSIGSGGGIKAVGKGKYKLGRVARPIKAKEKHYGLEYRPFAKVPVVFYVNKGVGVRNLSAKQVNDIYAGKIRNWSAVGGKKMPIRVVRREDGDSSLEVLLKTFPGFATLKMTHKAKIAVSTAEGFSAVELKEGAIGFGPYSDAVVANVNILNIDNVAPTNPAYPSATTLALIYKSQSAKGHIGRFLDFSASTGGREAIREAHAVPY